MTKLFQNKILWISIPVLALFAAITISGYLNSDAEQLDAFQMNGNVLLGYNGQEETISIPETVSVIGSSAFEGNQTIQKVTIPEGVTEIKTGAFRGCTQLKECTIPDSVLTIADNVFDGCTALEKVSVGNGLANLGNGAFSDCDSLKNISFHNNTKFQSSNGVLTDAKETVLYQFLAGNGITSYKMPDTIKDIKPYAFWGCDNLKSLDFSSGLNKINAYAAAQCSGLETIVLHEPVREIAMGAFANDKSLKEIVLPVSVTNIQDSAFTAIPKELRMICQEGSFAENYAVSNEYIPDISGKEPSVSSSVMESVQAVTSADSGMASENASGSLKSESAETVPDELQTDDMNRNETLQNQATNDNLMVETGNYGDEMQNAELGNGIIVSDRVFVMMDSPSEWRDEEQRAAKQESATNKTVNKIPDYAYYQDTQMSSLPLHAMQEITEIGKFAFARSNLESAEIPEGIKCIGYGAFYHADRLTMVTIPGSVTSIEPYAFYYTPWYESWKNNAAEDFLIVGDGVLLAYKGKAQTVTVPETVNYISSYAFTDDTVLEEVLLPEGIRKIESYAFSGCKNLKKIDYIQPDASKDVSLILEENSFADCPFINL